MHRTPYLTETEFASLSPIAAKILCCMASRGAWDQWRRGRVGRWCRRLMMSESSWRRGVRELMDMGVVQYRWTTGGFAFRIQPRKRFTAIPRHPDDRLLRMSPRAAKVLLAVARRADNISRSSHQRLATMARAIGRSVRTVGLGLAELVRLDLIVRHRTGRASWFVLCTDKSDMIDHHAGPIAPRSRLLLRILTLSTRDELLSALRAVRRPGLAWAIRQTGLVEQRACAGYAAAKIEVRRRLEKLGVSTVDAHALVIQYGPEEVDAVIQGRGCRRADKLARWIESAIRRRWALPDSAA